MPNFHVLFRYYATYTSNVAEIIHILTPAMVLTSIFKKLNKYEIKLGTII